MASELKAGGNGVDGKLILLTAKDESVITSEAAGSDTSGQPAASLGIGGQGSNGHLVIRGGKGGQLIDLVTRQIPGAAAAWIRVGGFPGAIEMFSDLQHAVIQIGGAGGRKGQIHLIRSATNQRGILMSGDEALIEVGGGGQPGYIRVSDDTGQGRVALKAATADIGAGGAGEPGSLFLRDGDGKGRVHLEASDAGIYAGGAGMGGTLKLRDGKGNNTIHFNGATGDLAAGGGGQGGNLILRDAASQDRVYLVAESATLMIGGNGQAGKVVARNNANKETVRIDGASGDIVLKNADCAEDFDVEGNPTPGAVVVLTDEGSIRPCSNPYDKRVVGIVSGAGEYQPGIVLDRKPSTTGRAPVALMGKVNCLADATDAPIRVGDLLTTSSRAGHAMRATDSVKAFGAIIGKAMKPLSSGTGLVPVLVMPG